ncbi:MAG: pentapeptide repeat-containing protein [Pannonibacter sp.]
MKMRLIEWLGFNCSPRYSDTKFLGASFGVLIILVGLAVALGGFATLFQFLAEILQLNPEHEAIRNIGLILVAVLGAPFVVWRAIVAQKQVDTAEQSHITDQINKAVAGLGADKKVDRIGRSYTIYTGDQNDELFKIMELNEFVLPEKSIEIHRERVEPSIGAKKDETDFSATEIRVRTWKQAYTTIQWKNTSIELEEDQGQGAIGDWATFSETLPNIEVRTGAIYALERIAQDSLRDHIQIMEILTAYIRENSPALKPDPREVKFASKKPRTDIQAALDVVGRRNSKGIEKEYRRKYRLDFRNVDLSCANLSNGNFDGVLLWDSNLENTKFRHCSLRGAQLVGCRLNFADFVGADLTGAILDNSTLSKTDIWKNMFVTAKSIKGISIAGTNLTGIYLPNFEKYTPIFGTKDTQLAHDDNERRSEHLHDIEKFTYSVLRQDHNEDYDLNKRLMRAGFKYWSPFNSNDLITQNLRSNFMKETSLIGFPFGE